jgi:hypothetical protein
MAIDIGRREFVTALDGTAIAWPLAARAQQPALPVIGFLSLAAASSSTFRLEALRAGLHDLGYVDGNNVVIESRWAAGPDQLREFATELVQRRVAVIVSGGNQPTLAVKSATSAIPTIFATADDPVRLGLVTSFDRPGGNMTGMSLISGALGAKRLELLRELVPTATLIAMLTNPNNPADAKVRDEQNAARFFRGVLPILPLLRPMPSPDCPDRAPERGRPSDMGGRGGSNGTSYAPDYADCRCSQSGANSNCARDFLGPHGFCDDGRHHRWHRTDPCCSSQHSMWRGFGSKRRLDRQC